MSLNRKFFEHDAEAVARQLLGQKLVRVFADGARKEGVITETEAYLGIEDKAAHSFGGRRTKRTEVMFGKAGVAYVYFTYGLHWLLNVVVGKIDDPQAVLIRAVDGISGPARLTKYLEIDGSFNGEDLAKSKRIWIEDLGVKIGQQDVRVTPRIGIDYAKEWKDKPLRFLLEKSV